MLARVSVLTALLLALWLPAQAQFATPTLPFVQVGAAGVPGVGVQVGFGTPAFTVLTREGALYTEYRFNSEANDGRDGFLVGLGIGGSLRVLRALTVLADLRTGPFDLDLGLRLGPSFFFSEGESARNKARSFNLFAEPFVRGSARLGRRVVYAEAGTQRAHLRFGLLLGL